HTEGKLPLIGVGGIDSGETALAKIAAGASLIQLYTAVVFEGLGLIARIKRALVEAIEQANADSLAPLIGRRAEEWASREAAPGLGQAWRYRNLRCYNFAGTKAFG